MINYTIGHKYKYPLYYKKYTLIEVSKSGFVFIFECGHKVTDLVFKDMIDCKTNIQVYKDTQIKLAL